MVFRARPPRLPLLSALLACLVAAAPPSASAAKPRAAQTLRGEVGRYQQQPQVEQFIDAMVERHGFVRAELQTLFRKVAFQPSVVKAISPPTDPTVRSWRNYRALFVNAPRIEAGRRFRSAHAATLARAEAEFGVPQDIIVAIIGVETVYGRNMGSYRVIDALATLAFDYPRRADYFRSELEHYLLYAREADLDVFALRGSYAGAFGIPQFMPGSYRRWAVDFDGDARTDLVRSPADAIGSVANFLREHGWQRGAAVAFPVQGDSDAVRKLADGSIKPSLSPAELAAAGVTPIAPPGAIPADALCVVVELETPGQPSEYRAALENFYVITRYNRSSFYAAAVMDLAQALGPGPDAKTPPDSGS
jgi:membrane-bound lytic murein transglycosylase B